MHWIIGVSDASSISIARILSPMMWFSHVTGQPLLSDRPTIRQRRLSFFGHLCRADRHWSRPLPSSPGLHSGSSHRLATKNWKTEANLAAERTVEDDLRPLYIGLGDGALWIERHGIYSWMRLRPRDTLQREITNTVNKITRIANNENDLR